MRRLLLILSLSMVLALFTAFQDTQFRIEVEAVNVYVTVVDENGRFVTGLSQDQFIVYEDGIPQPITNFAREGDLPLRVALLIDTSSSVQLKLGFEKEAAINFIRSVMRLRDRALLVQFDRGVTMLNDFTDRPAEIVQNIRSLEAGGGTSLWDAIYQVSREKMFGMNARKTIILLSDGEDRDSLRNLEETLEMAQVSEVTIYSIGTSRFGASSSKDGEDTLQHLSEETGGTAFFPYSAQRLDEAFDMIDRELRSQYTLTYEPRDTKPDGHFREIEVRLVEGEDYKLRHRKGYRLPDL